MCTSCPSLFDNCIELRKLVANYFHSKMCQRFVSSFLNVKICSFSLSSMIAIEESFDL